MRVTILGGDGAWPRPGGACSGYLVQHDGYTLLLDPGYATFPELLAHVAAADVDAVYVTHGHPDHCVDLNPLLRARALDDRPPPPLPVFAPPGELDAVLALDHPHVLAGAYLLPELPLDRPFALGPFQAEARHLPHSRPNVGLRLGAGGVTIAYTGDTGASPEIAALARDAALLVGEASYADAVPEDEAAMLSSAASMAASAREACVGRLLLAHLLPDTDPGAARAAAQARFAGEVQVARRGTVIDL